MKALNSAIGFFLVIGCSNDPGSMMKTEVEAKIKGAMKLDSVKMSEATDDGYKNVWTAADGSRLAITVVRDKKDKSLKYSAKGEKGNLQASGFKNY